ncbi:hypothetical protein FACS1894109_14100 [Spirochaetia bacterium]|nr:hypothetical protein FACS1894109_14100 [Spirochaetia bacterium]
MALRLWLKPLVFLAVFSAALCVPVFSKTAVSSETAVSVEATDSDETDSVYAVLRKWIAAETALGIYRAWPDDGFMALLALEETAEAVRDFKRGHQYYAYSISGFSHEAQVDDILSLLEDLAAAVRTGQAAGSAHTVDAVRDTIIAWQQYDAALMNNIQLNYVYQNSIFIITILALVCFLVLQLRKIKQADAKAERSAAFSRDIILAQEQERQRIARELHGTVIPEIRRIGFLSRGTQFKEMPRNHEIERVCNTLILSIREICQNLIPPNFNLLGLGESLKNLCIAFETRSGIECRPIIPDNVNLGTLNPDMQLQCYRMVQEALTNIEKHAKASEASVTLRIDGNTETPKALLIFVTDDGTGFDPSRAQVNSYPHSIPPASKGTAHMGIRGMYDRMGILGGALSFQTGPGEGVMVRMEIPLGK